MTVMGGRKQGLRSAGLALAACALLLLAALPAFAEEANGAKEPEKPAVKPSSALTVQSADGKYSMTFGLTTQMLYTWTEKDFQNDEKEKPLNPHPTYGYTFTWRRLRAVASGNLFTKDLKYSYQVSLAPGKLEHIDYYLDYALLPNFQVRVGQYKIPFTRYRINSFKALDLVEWPVANLWFGAERQIGITFHNGWEKPPMFEYEVGVYNGMNSRVADAQGMAIASGYPTVSASDLWQDKTSAAAKLLIAMGKENPYVLDEVHPALALHFAYNFGGIDPGTLTDWDKTGFRFSVGGSGYWDANPVVYRDFSLRLAPEFMLKLYGWTFLATYYAGFWEQNGDIDVTTLGEEGLVVTTGYLIGQNVEIAARYSAVTTTSRLRDVFAEHAAKVIAAATPEEDEDGNVDPADQAAYDAIKKQYKNAGLMEKEEEFNVGVNFHLIKKVLKLSNDFSWLIHTPEQGSAKEDLRFRSQIQVAF